MPLTMADIGKECIIKSCHVDGDLKRHVDNLGLLPGERVTLLSRNGGNVILKVKDSRLAISMGIASKIYVA